MGINFDLINAMGNSRGSWSVYAARHHVSTRETPWTDEEFNAGRSKFGSATWSNTGDNRKLHAEEYLNWHHESVRRAVERAMKDNQFNFVVRDFDPRIVNERREFSHQSNIFQTLANTFEKGKVGLDTLNKAFGGRFIGEADLEVRLGVLHEQFNAAFRSVADLFLEFAPSLGLDAQRVANDVLTFGELIRYHISSGQPASTMETMLRNNTKTSMSFDELNNLGMAVHQQFNFRG